jgi:hypothetical protein
MLLYLTLFEKYHRRTLFVLAKLTRQKENLHPVGLKVYDMNDFILKKLMYNCVHSSWKSLLASCFLSTTAEGLEVVVASSFSNLEERYS